MNILIAPNAFKNSLDAGKVAEAISKGLQQSKLSCSTRCFPVADGGDGTAGLLIEHLKGKYIQATVHDPLGRKITSSFGLVNNDKTAIIELADASGLRLLTPAEYDPLRTTTFGTGELIHEAINRKVDTIIICIGGSATVDGGTGMLQALGVKFLDAQNQDLKGLPASLISLADIIIPSFAAEVQNKNIIVLCDVENTFLGPQGAAAVFGPQKGATASNVELLESCLKKLRDVVLNRTGKDMEGFAHGGAAGGISAALHVFFKARLMNGIDHFLDITAFKKELKSANLVITGEGSIDKQTLQGKGPFGVAKMAKEFSIPVIGLAGKITPDTELNNYFDQLICINDNDADQENAIRNTYSNLQRAAVALGNRLYQKGN